jgi:hypothetical protein
MNLRRRVDRLEERTGTRGTAIVWQNENETPTQAIDRHVRERPQDNRKRVVVVRWRREGDTP